MKYEGYTEFEANKTKGDNNVGVDIDSLYEGQTNVQIEGFDVGTDASTPAFYIWNSMNWHEDTYCGWKTFKGEQGHNKVGDTIECVITNTVIENDILKQELIQRIYGSDEIVGRAWASHFMKKKEDYKEKQQDLTELNGDGNRDRGRYGEDVS